MSSNPPPAAVDEEDVNMFELPLPQALAHPSSHSPSTRPPRSLHRPPHTKAGQQQASSDEYIFTYEAAIPAAEGSIQEARKDEADSTTVNVFELDQAGTAAAIAALPPVPPSDADSATEAPSGSSVPNWLPMRLLAHLTSDRWAEMFWATATNRERLCQFMYNHSLVLSVATQVTCMLLFLIVEPTAIKFEVPFKASMAVLLVLCQFTQLLILFLAHWGMARELRALYVRPRKVWNMYLSVVLSFAAVYFTCFCFQRRSFQVDGYAASGEEDVDPDHPDDGGLYEDLETSNNIPTVFIYFMYFSGAIMTSVGFGDITPLVWYSQLFTNAQMLLGTMYHVGVFGLTLSHFRTFQKVSAAQEEAEAAALAAGNVPRRHVVLRAWERFAAIPWVIRLRGHPVTNRVKKFCIRYLVLVCISFQTLNTLLLFSIPDPFRALKPSDEWYVRKVVVLTFITLFQTGMFVGVMWVSIRLVKKINNADITPGFLIQSFLATALLFGGIYFVLFAATPHHQFSHTNAFEKSIFEVLYVFVHFSLTVMTTTGFGDVYARGIVARLFVLTQMLISILYSAVIIGLGTSQLIDMQAARSEQQFAKQQAEAEATLMAEAQEEAQAAAKAEAEAEARRAQQQEQKQAKTARQPRTKHAPQQPKYEEYDAV